MKVIKFKRVIVENYGPFVDRIELEFKPNRFIFIFGPNGIGKTTLLNALAYCNYGVTSKKETGDDLVNNITEKNLYVRTDLTVDGIEYKSERYHKHSQHRNTALIHRKKSDGEWELVARGSKETIPYITKLVCSKEVFNNTLFFAQGINVLFEDLKDIFGKIMNFALYTNYRDEVKNRKKVFEKEIEDINVTVNKNIALIENNSERIEYIENKEIEFDKLKLASLDKLNREFKIFETQEMDLTQKIKDFDFEDPDKLKVTIQTLNESIIKNIQNHKNTNQKITDIKKDLDQKKQIKIAELMTEKSTALIKINDKYKVIEKEIQDLFNESGRVLAEKNGEIQKSLNILKIEGTNFKSKITNLKFNIQEIKTNQSLEGTASCPTCEQDITEEVIQKIDLKVKNYENEIIEHKQYILLTINEQLKEQRKKESEVKDELNQLIQEKTEKVKEIEQYKNDEIKKCEDKLTVLVTKVNNLAKQQYDQAVIEIKSQEKELKQSIDNDTKKLNDIETKMGELQDLYEEMKEATNDKKLKVEEIKKEKESIFDKSEIELIDEQIDKLNYEIESLTLQTYSIEYKIKMAKFWLDAFSPSGIPNKLIDDSIPFMNLTVQTYMDQLSHGRYLVSFDTMTQTKKGEFRDKVSVNVVDTINKTMQRKSLSGGQNRIIDIGIILTLRDLQNNINNISFNILMLDEILDSLDQDNRKATVDILRQVLNSDESDLCINLISHTQLDFIERDVDVILNL